MNGSSQKKKAKWPKLLSPYVIQEVSISSRFMIEITFHTWYWIPNVAFIYGKKWTN